MEPRVHSLDEELLIAEHAAEWLLRAQAADAREMERLLEWLCRSPQNAGELLVATSMDLAMRQFFQSRHERIDVDQLLSSSVNVLTIRDQVLQPPQRSTSKRSRIFAAASLGVAATTVALVVTPTPVRSWLHPCECITSAGEQRVIDLPEGSAIAIHAGSGVLVLFAANPRDVYADVGLPMFASAKDPARPFRVRVIPSTGEGTNTSQAPLIQAVGGNVDVLRQLDRIAQSIGVVAPPLAISLPAMNPWDAPIIVERKGSDVMIR